MYTRPGLVAACLVLVVAGDSYAPPPRRGPREPLAGIWKVVRAEFNGQPVKEFADARVTFFDYAITVLVQDKQIFIGDYSIGPQDSAHALTVISVSRPDPAFPLPFSRKDEIFKGFFELKIDKAKESDRQLEICLAKPDAERPKKLESPQGKEILYVVMTSTRR